jgi:hypothetical protein
MNSGFHVYENWRARGHKAVIHRDSCGHCNNGHGTSGGTDPKNGQWHGPFPTLQQAQAFSSALRNVATRTEHRCI